MTSRVRVIARCSGFLREAPWGCRWKEQLSVPGKDDVATEVEGRNFCQEDPDRHIDPSSLKLPFSIIILVFTNALGQLDKISQTYISSLAVMSVSSISKGADNFFFFSNSPKDLAEFLEWSKHSTNSCWFGLVSQIGRSSDHLNFITYKIGMTVFYPTINTLWQYFIEYKSTSRWLQGKPVAYGLHRPTA